MNNKKIVSFQNDINEQYLLACKNGDVYTVEYLLVNKNADIHYKNDLAFIIACEYGYLDLVKFLLTSTQLSRHINIHTQNDRGVRMCGQMGHYDLLIYLTSSEDLADHANISAKKNDTLILACKNILKDKGTVGYYDKIITYLLTSNNISNKPNIYINNNQIFHLAFSQLEVCCNQLINKLIFEFNIDIKKIEKDLKFLEEDRVSKNFPERQYALRYFYSAIQKRTFEQELNNKKTKNTTIKL